MWVFVVIHFSGASHRNSWALGHATLSNIDGYWGKLIDSYTEYVDPFPSIVWVAIDVCDETTIIQPGSDYICANGLLLAPEEGYMVTILPTKNDVIVQPEYATWSPGQHPNDRNTNWLYDDIPADGGYNHFEIMRYKRAYTLPDVFQVGSFSPPMKETADWLKDVVLD